jgi:hypothetical protein
MIEFFRLMFQTMASCIAKLNLINLAGVGLFDLLVVALLFDIIIANVIRRG